MAFKRLEVGAFAPVVPMETPSSASIWIARFDAPARRSIAIVLTIVAHLVLLKLLLAFAVAAKVPDRAASAPRLLMFDVVGTSNSEAAAAPVSPAVVKKITPPVAEPEEIAAAIEPLPVEWKVSKVESSSQQAGTAGASGMTGAAVGSGNGGAYDPYAGAAPRRRAAAGPRCNAQAEAGQTKFSTDCNRQTSGQSGLAWSAERSATTNGT